jgi:hypothetical protein
MSRYDMGEYKMRGFGSIKALLILVLALQAPIVAAEPVLSVQLSPATPRPDEIFYMRINVSGLGATQALNEIEFTVNYNPEQMAPYTNCGDCVLYNGVLGPGDRLDIHDFYPIDTDKIYGHLRSTLNYSELKALQVYDSFVLIQGPFLRLDQPGLHNPYISNASLIGIRPDGTTYNAVPELDVTSGTAALVLLGGGLALASEHRKRRRC